jgi:hypothetical protein
LQRTSIVNEASFQVAQGIMKVENLPMLFECSTSVDLCDLALAWPHS